VELGCGRIVPVLAERTEKHLAQAAAKRAERWRRLALEAAKQSRRSDLPEIGEPARLAAILSTDQPVAVAEEPGAEGIAASSRPVRILLSEMEEDQPLLRILQQNAGEAETSGITLAIGPEGGWSAAEIALFARAGWHSASLGPRILRVETAVIAALAIVNSCIAPAP
jgi:16S rRNA (uracil1498-N3)-methyltransferase